MWAGKRVKGADEIAKFQTLDLVWFERLIGIPWRKLAFARRAAHLADVLMMYDREEPGAKIGSEAPQMNFRERPAQRLLNQILGIDPVMGQRHGVPRQTRDKRLDLLVKV